MSHTPRQAGVPQAIGKPRLGAPGQVIDAELLRDSWTLDVLAWAQHGVMAKKIDLHGAHAPLPPVILPDDGQGRTVALDLLAALQALRSRPRAFSQMAGRYAPLVIGAQDGARVLAIELWHLDGEVEEREKWTKLAEQLATYLRAEVTLRTPADARRLLREAQARGLPEALQVRNPIAWALAEVGK